MQKIRRPGSSPLDTGWSILQLAERGDHADMILEHRNFQDCATHCVSGRGQHPSPLDIQDSYIPC